MIDFSKIYGAKELCGAADLQADKSPVLFSAEDKQVSYVGAYSYILENTGIHYISGEISSYTAEYFRMGKQLAEDAGALNHVIIMNSHGGSGGAMFDIIDTIESAEKPVACYIHGSAYSAAGFISLACSYIGARTARCGVGSLGVYASGLGYKKTIETDTYVYMRRYAEGSGRKNEISESVADADDTKLQKMLNDARGEVFGWLESVNKAAAESDFKDGRDGTAAEAFGILCHTIEPDVLTFVKSFASGKYTGGDKINDLATVTGEVQLTENESVAEADLTAIDNIETENLNLNHNNLKIKNMEALELIKNLGFDKTAPLAVAELLMTHAGKEEQLTLSSEFIEKAKTEAAKPMEAPKMEMNAGATVQKTAAKKLETPNAELSAVDSAFCAVLGKQFIDKINTMRNE